MRELSRAECHQCPEEFARSNQYSSSREHEDVHDEIYDGFYTIPENNRWLAHESKNTETVRYALHHKDWLERMQALLYELLH